MSNNLQFSIVVPVYNEEDNVSLLHQEIVAVLNAMQTSYELIFVDDGSTDKTLLKLKDLQPIKIISFRKNFGQTSALDAGIKESKGSYIICLDGDGQNDPASIPALYQKLIEEDLDLVSGWRKDRKDPFFKKLSSKMIAELRKFLIHDGVHDSGCTLKIYKQECFKNVNLYGEMHRFIPALLKIKGFKIGELEVNHRPRLSGQTKYNWKRGVKGLLDLFSLWFWHKYSHRPLHLFGSLGLALILFSFVSVSIAIYQKIVHQQSLSNTALTDLSMLTFFIGVLFFVFGLMADILVKIYFSTTRDKYYDIKNVIKK